VVADQLYIDRIDLPSALTARLIRLAAFQNPEFYRAQSMRFPTFGKLELSPVPNFIGVMWGCPAAALEEDVELIRGEGAEVEFHDLRVIGNPLASRVRLRGMLSEPQIKGFEALHPHENGVLAATTAFGKTVVPAALIAQRGCNALVLVHRRELLAQWVERLRTFLDIDPKDIGLIGAGRRKPTGVIDVALIQSLVRRGEVSDMVADYGHLVVDECHHLSATSFELVARRAKGRYVLGLSATVARKDGHHPIIFMQCGPVRHRVDARAYAAGRGIIHRVTTRSTQFQLPPPLGESDRPSMPAVYAAIARDELRNNLIFDDVLKVLEVKRSPIVLTERLDDLEYLQDRFSRFVRNLVVLRGGMSVADRKVSDAGLRVAGDQERLILVDRI